MLKIDRIGLMDVYILIRSSGNEAENINVYGDWPTWDLVKKEIEANDGLEDGDFEGDEALSWDTDSWVEVPHGVIWSLETFAVQSVDD